jgi:hypothetical protein
LRGRSAASRQAEAPSDVWRTSGRSSRCASMCRLAPSGAEKRCRCPCVTLGRRRVGAAHSFCHTFAQPLRLRILPTVNKLQTGGQKPRIHCSAVEPGPPGMRREACQRVPLHLHHLHHATERQHAGGQMQCKFLSNFGEYTARITYIVHMYVAFSELQSTDRSVEESGTAIVGRAAAHILRYGKITGKS